MPQSEHAVIPSPGAKSSPIRGGQGVKPAVRGSTVTVLLYQGAKSRRGTSEK